MSAMKACFQIAECSLSSAKIRKNNEEYLILHVFNYTKRLILHISACITQVAAFFPTNYLNAKEDFENLLTVITEYPIYIKVFR